MKTLIAASATVWIIGAPVQGPSPEDIAAAIDQGKAGKTLQKRCAARGDNGFDIVAEGPIGRIMRAARDAKRQNKEFTAADVTPAMSGAWLTVTATRFEPLRKQVTEYVTPGFNLEYRTYFVLRSRPPGSEQAIVLKPLGPIRYNSENVRGNVVSVKVSGPAPADVMSLLPLPGSDMAAWFDLAAFKAIPHRDVDIVVFMTDSGEHKCKLSENDRKTLK